MGYFGHTCELPLMERPMGPCPACQYSREMAELAERGKKIKQEVRVDASRVDPALAVELSRSTPDAVAVAAASLRGEGTTREEPPTRYARFDGMTWPLYDGDVNWRFRYGTPTRTDLLYAASVLEAYADLINTTTARRATVVRQLRAATALRAPSPDGGTTT